MTKRVVSSDICPKCRGRATKLYSVSSGIVTCQQCDHRYHWPKLDDHGDFQYCACATCAIPKPTRRASA